MSVTAAPRMLSIVLLSRPLLLAAGLAALGACGRLSFAPGTDDDAPAPDAPRAAIDANPLAPDAAAGVHPWSHPPVFGAPTHLDVLASTTSEFDPFLAPDHLTLYFSSARGGNSDIYRATRPTVAGAFGAPTALGADINTASNETTFVTTPDGLTAFVVSDRGGNYDFYTGTRAAPGAAFGALSAIAELNSGNSEFNIGLSGDQRSLWFCSDRPGGGGGAQDLWFTTRASLDAPWDAPVPSPFNSSGNDGGPTLSADGRVIVFAQQTPANSADLFYAYRADPTQPFGPAQPLTALNTALVETTPFLRDDGRELFFTREAGDGQGDADWDLWVVPVLD